MFTAARTDRNQPDIVRALRAAGCTVHCLHQLGGGVPDLLVGRTVGGLVGGRRNFLLEVKDSEKPPSARRLTPDQEKWHREWGGQVAVVTTVEEAMRAVGLL